MTAPHSCQSCGMPIETGDYCQHCVDDQGHLQTFDERLERMTQWLVRAERAKDRTAAREQALAHMATMPAWRSHPQLKAARARRHG